jgi:preprotein translocase subunit SecB
MSSPRLSVIAQYVQYSRFDTHIRPYALKSPISTELSVGLSVSPLPEDGHYRVELSVRLHAGTPSSEKVYAAEIGLEAIVSLADAQEVELTSTLKSTIGPNLLGAARVVLSSISANTGYGPVVLPPFPAERFLDLPAISLGET